MDTSVKAKSRQLTVYEYFQMLQVEWIVADLRVRIYPKRKDKEYWTKVKEGKKKVIDSIAEKNCLPTIFTDEEMKRIFELKIYRDKGLPAFSYRDDQHKTIQEPLDYIYYYNQGAEVRFEYFGEQKIGRVKSFIPEQPIMLVTDFEGKTYDIPVSEVTRIL